MLMGSDKVIARFSLGKAAMSTSARFLLGDLRVHLLGVAHDTKVRFNSVSHLACA